MSKVPLYEVKSTTPDNRDISIGGFKTTAEAMTTAEYIKSCGGKNIKIVYWGYDEPVETPYETLVRVRELQVKHKIVKSDKRN